MNSQIKGVGSTSHTIKTKKGMSGFSAVSMLMGVICMAITGSALAADGDGYQPAQTLGSGENDWWTAYPSQHARAGSPVEHLSWVLEALKDKPVLILVHSSNCKPCLAQIANMEAIMASHGEDVTYYDILAESSDIQKAMQLLDVYGPTGGQQYVPTTIFLTLIKGSDGKVDVAWHSAEDAMGRNQIEAYVQDAVYYHRLNRGDWS